MGEGELGDSPGHASGPFVQHDLPDVCRIGFPGAERKNALYVRSGSRPRRQLDEEGDFLGILPQKQHLALVNIVLRVDVGDGHSPLG